MFIHTAPPRKPAAAAVVVVGSSIPQFRHASAAYLIPTLEPRAGVTTPAPSSITSPTPKSRQRPPMLLHSGEPITFMTSDLTCAQVSMVSRQVVDRTCLLVPGPGVRTNSWRIRSRYGTLLSTAHRSESAMHELSRDWVSKQRLGNASGVAWFRTARTSLAHTFVSFGSVKSKLQETQIPRVYPVLTPC